MKRRFKRANMPKSFRDKEELQDLKEVKKALQTWIKTMKTYDPDAVTALYADDASFWGTMASSIATDKAGIKAYFVDFLQKDNLEIEITDEYIEFHDDGKEAVYAGAYNFSFTDEKGTNQTVPARFTFIFAHQDSGEWLIKHHHSSEMPAAPAPCRAQKPH